MAKKQVASLQNTPHVQTRYHEIDTDIFIPETYSEVAPSISDAGGTNLIFKYVRSGVSAELNIDGSSSSVDFDYVAEVDTAIERINIEIVDGSIRNDRFAGLAAALPNGLLFKVFDSDGTTELFDFCDNVPITITSDFVALAGTDSIIAQAAGDDSLPIRWTLGKSGKMLKLTAGQRFRITVQDDLSTITRFRAMVQGYKL